MASVGGSQSSPGFLRGNAALIILLIGAAIIRIWCFPGRDELRDGDEIGYVTDGVVAWEGILPGWKAVPAGPQAWISWLYTAGRSAWEVVHPPKGPPPPKIVKPFMAIERALCGIYEDLGPLRRVFLWFSLALAMCAIFAAYRMGVKYGGLAGGVLVGGLVAVLPLYVEYAGITKSCSDAWMFGTLAVACAATLRERWRLWVPGVLLGLAITSRIDMVLVTPLVAWALWDNCEPQRFWKTLLINGGAMAVAGVFSVPWAFLGFVGTLRNLAAGGVIGWWGQIQSPRLRTLKELTWDQGLGPILLMTAVAFFLSPTRGRKKAWVLGILAGLLVVSMFLGNYQLIRYRGGNIIAIMTAAAVGLGALLNRWPKGLGVAVAGLLLVLPLAQAFRVVEYWKGFYAPDSAVEWIEKRVPAGTTVYLQCAYTSKTVLPTPEAADAIWRLVASDQAWRVKFEEVLSRFSMQSTNLPRAMSEDNMSNDRSTCRRWFILGGGNSPRPRFDVRLIAIGPTFGIRHDEIVQEMNKNPGVLVWRTVKVYPLPAELGEPAAKWVNSKGNGTYIFVSRDIKEKLAAGL